MPKFSVNVLALATSASANTYATLLALKFANTTGHRARLRRLVLGGAGGAPEDLQVSFRLRRSNNTGDGTSTAVNVNTIAKADAGSVASNVAAIGKNHTVEPTDYENGALAGGSFNSRGTMVLEWAPGEGPLWGPNQALGLEAASGEADSAALQATLEWEEF